MPSTITEWRIAARLLAAVLALAVPIAAAAQTSAPGNDPPHDPFARRAWTLELGGHGALETWNYNVSHEEMQSLYTGVTYGVGRGVTVKVGAPLYYVWQRGTDGYLLGLTFGVRSRALRRPRWSVFWEFEVGISESDTYVPPRGTRFNYLAIGGGGIAWRLRPGLQCLAGMRWVHVSNNGLAGSSRNPDIEAVGPTIGVLIGF
jgi:hypothetical protein